MSTASGAATSPRPHAHRDADEEALQAALMASVQPDFLAEILQAEEATQHHEPPQAPVPPLQAPTDALVDAALALSMATMDDDDEDLVALALGEQLRVQDDDDDDDDANGDHKLLNFAENLLLDLLRYLDEDSVGSCLCTCKRLQHVARADELFETLCRRIFPAQNPRVAVAAAANRFELHRSRFRSWFDMFRDRPRVRHNGFYWLRISYYKKPELNMWSEVTPSTILQVVYYRYFSFQRDGTVLYAMLFKPPHEAAAELRDRRKDVFLGRYHVERDDVFVSVPTRHNVVEFRLSICSTRGRGANGALVLDEHYSFSEPDRTGWVDYYHTNEEEFQYYRSWNL